MNAMQNKDNRLVFGLFIDEWLIIVQCSSRLNTLLIDYCHAQVIRSWNPLTVMYTHLLESVYFIFIFILILSIFMTSE